MLINLFIFFMIIICFFGFLHGCLYLKYLWNLNKVGKFMIKIDKKKKYSFLHHYLEIACFSHYCFGVKIWLKASIDMSSAIKFFFARFSRFKTIYFCRLYVQRLTQVNSYQQINQKWFKSLISQLGLYIR